MGDGVLKCAGEEEEGDEEDPPGGGEAVASSLCCMRFFSLFLIPQEVKREEGGRWVEEKLPSSRCRK